MKITKYEHSCVVIEDQEKQMVIDPGKFSTSFIPSDKIVAVVITHVHSDHFDPEIVKKIKELNPGARLYSTEQVTQESPELKFETVSAGSTAQAEPFRLSFFGGNHELYQGFENVGVLVNNSFYYPGDSYAVPNQAIKVLAAPASAPWLRVTEASQFIKDCKPGLVFPVHNAVLSEIGEEIHYRILSGAAQEVGSKWSVLKPAESIEA